MLRRDGPQPVTPVHVEQPVIADGRGVGVTTTLALAIGGPLFALMSFLVADDLAPRGGATKLILAALVTFIVWGAFSYAVVRQFRSATPRWKAGVGAGLSAAWSMASWSLLWIVAFALSNGSVL